MSRPTNSYHQLQFKTHSKSQIPQAFFSTHSSPNIEFYDESIISQITLDFSEKINNLQAQIDNLRMEFNTQIQSLNSRTTKEDIGYKLLPKEKEISYCFDCINHNRNHKLNFNYNLYNSNLVNKVKKTVLNSISNKNHCMPKTATAAGGGVVNYKDKPRIASNLKYKKNLRNRQNLLSYFLIRNEEKEKIKRMIIDAKVADRKSFDCTSTNKNIVDTENNLLNTIPSPSHIKNRSLHSVNSNYNDNNDSQYSNTKIQVISSILIHNETVSFKDKLKLMYLNKEIKNNNLVSTLLNESCIPIYQRIQDLSVNHTNNKKTIQFPSDNILTSLNLLPSSFDLFIKEQLQEINSDLASDLFKIIYMLLDLTYNPEKLLNTNDAYDNLMSNYNVNSLKDLFNCIINKVNSSSNDFAIETKITVINTLKQHPILMTTLDNIPNEFKPLTYITGLFSEINILFTEDINISKEISKFQQELLSFKDIIKINKNIINSNKA